MANPIIQAIYDLKDNISGRIKTINDALRGNRSEADKTAETSERSTRRMSEGYKKTADALTGLRTALAAVAAVAGLNEVKDGIVAVAEAGERLDDLEKQFTTAFGGIEAGSEALAKVRTLAEGTPQSFEDVAAAAIKLRQLGFDPLDGTLQALIDNQNALDQSQEGLIATIDALGKANVRGGVNMKSLVALTEQGIPVFDLLSKSLGVSSDRVRELAESGQLGEDTIKQLVSELGKLRAGAAADELGDLDSQFQKIKDTAREFLETIARSGALDFFREKVKELNDEVAAAAKDGRLKELAQSISDGIVATGTAVRDTITLVVNYAGAIGVLARGYALFKAAGFVANLAQSARALKATGDTAKKSAGDIDVATGALGRLRAASAKIPSQIQFAVTAVAVDFTLGQIEKLIEKVQEYLSVQEKLKAIQRDAAQTQADLAARAKTFAELFKASADVQIASADELAGKSRLQATAYVDQLQNAIRYYTALRVQLRAAGDDDGVTKITAKLGDLGRALGDAEAALNRAGGAIATSTGAFARDAVKAFEKATQAGKDTVGALSGVFNGVDLGTPKGARDVVETLEVIGPRAKDARAALEGELLTALQKIDGQGLRNFQASAVEAFAATKGAAQDAAIVMEATLEAGLTRLGVKAANAGVAITTTGRDVIATFQAIAENAAATSDQIEQAFEAAIGKASTKEEIAALGDALKDATDKGRVGFKDAADAAGALAIRVREVQAASGPLADDFERLGIKSQAQLDATRDSAKRAFDAIVDGARRGAASQDDITRAFKAYADAARAAAADSSSTTKQQVEDQLAVQASVLGISDALGKAGDAGKDAGDKTAKAFGDAKDSIDETADAADNLAQNANAAAGGVGNVAANANLAAANLAAATQGIVLLSAEQMRNLVLIGKELSRGAITIQDYEDRIQEAMTGTSQRLQEQLQEFIQFTARMQDLKNQIAEVDAGDDPVAQEEARHEKALEDLRQESTTAEGFNSVQYALLKRLEDELHAKKLKNIEKEAHARKEAETPTDDTTDAGTPSAPSTQRRGGIANVQQSAPPITVNVKGSVIGGTPEQIAVAFAPLIERQIRNIERRRT